MDSAVRCYLITHQEGQSGFTVRERATMQSVACPSDAELSSFAEGRLSGTLLDRLAEHLSCCPRCQQRIASFDEQPDAVVRALRRPEARDSGQEDEAVRRLLAP